MNKEISYDYKSAFDKKKLEEIKSMDLEELKIENAIKKSKVPLDVITPDVRREINTNMFNMIESIKDILECGEISDSQTLEEIVGVFEDNGIAINFRKYLY